jgi:hypothetical protein
MVSGGILICPWQIEIGAAGFEPATLWSQTRCASPCATPRLRSSSSAAASPSTLERSLNTARPVRQKAQGFFTSFGFWA